MEPLVHVINAWLSISFGLPKDAPEPNIRFVPEETLSRVWIENVAHEQGTSIRDVERQLGAIAIEACYDEPTLTILLGDDWNPGSPRDVSVVVHEMVHHLQHLDGQRFACPEAREKLAYEAQQDWLVMFGTSLEEKFRVDPMTLLLSTKCMH